MAGLEYEKALGIALKALRTSDKLEVEIRNRLAERGTEATTIEQVVAFLFANRLLNDAAVIERLSAKYPARNKLVAVLESRGLAAEAMQDLPQADESEAASILLNAKRPKSAPQAARYLVGQGFEEEAVQHAVEKYFGDSR